VNRRGKQHEEGDGSRRPGDTVRLAAARAKGIGPALVLAGRNEDPLQARMFVLDDLADVRRGLQDIDVPLNCAGPFVHTVEPLMTACQHTVCHESCVWQRGAWRCKRACRQSRCRAHARFELLCSAAWEFVRGVLHRSVRLLYGAIDCIEANL
jgi:hypothetical protein